MKRKNERKQELDIRKTKLLVTINVKHAIFQNFFKFNERQTFNFNWQIIQILTACGSNVRCLWCVLQYGMCKQ